MKAFYMTACALVCCMGNPSAMASCVMIRDLEASLRCQEMEHRMQQMEQRQRQQEQQMRYRQQQNFY